MLPVFGGSEFVACCVANMEWNSVEIERFQQAMVEHDKDFVKISQHVSINIGLTVAVV